MPLAQAERAGNAVRVPYEAATVTEGPHLEVDGGQLDETQQRLLYRYYGLDYAWSRSEAACPAGKPPSRRERGSVVTRRTSVRLSRRVGRGRALAGRPSRAGSIAFTRRI